MKEVFTLCRNNQWSTIFERVRAEPEIAVEKITMTNHITTTILHQAITSKGNVALRCDVIMTILHQTPMAAQIKNGYGSLPLHVISQRNVKMNSKTKEQVIRELVRAYAEGVVVTGGVGLRTPLHISFTDYISPQLTKLLVENGSKACFMKDKKGYLPAHVACSRHCSPEKLRMLLDVNPQAVFEPAKDGATLLDLARSTATKTHPNFALINELESYLKAHGAIDEVKTVNSDGLGYSFSDSWAGSFDDQDDMSLNPPNEVTPESRRDIRIVPDLIQSIGQTGFTPDPFAVNGPDAFPMTACIEAASMPASYATDVHTDDQTDDQNLKRKAVSQSPNDDEEEHQHEKRRKSVSDNDEINPDASLLLHFSRNASKDEHDEPNSSFSVAV